MVDDGRQGERWGAGWQGRQRLRRQPNEPSVVRGAAVLCACPCASLQQWRACPCHTALACRRRPCRRRPFPAVHFTPLPEPPPACSCAAAPCVTSPLAAANDPALGCPVEYINLKVGGAVRSPAHVAHAAAPAPPAAASLPWSAGVAKLVRRVPRCCCCCTLAHMPRPPRRRGAHPPLARHCHGLQGTTRENPAVCKYTGKGGKVASCRRLWQAAHRPQQPRGEGLVCCATEACTWFAAVSLHARLPEPSIAHGGTTLAPLLMPCPSALPPSPHTMQATSTIQTTGWVAARTEDLARASAPALPHAHRQLLSSECWDSHWLGRPMTGAPWSAARTLNVGGQVRRSARPCGLRPPARAARPPPPVGNTRPANPPCCLLAHPPGCLMQPQLGAEHTARFTASGRPSWEDCQGGASSVHCPEAARVGQGLWHWLCVAVVVTQCFPPPSLQTESACCQPCIRCVYTGRGFAAGTGGCRRQERRGRCVLCLRHAGKGASGQRGLAQPPAVSQGRTATACRAYHKFEGWQGCVDPNK